MLTPLCAVAMSATALVPTTGDDPAAVLEAARAAVARTGAIEYHASLTTEGPMASAMGSVPDALVIVGAPHGRTGIPMPRPFLVDGELVRGDERMPVEASFDGTVVRALIPSEKGMLKQTLRPGTGFAMVEAYEMLMPGFGAIPLEGRPSAELRSGGQVEVGGRLCDVVEIFEVSEIPPQGDPQAPTAYELVRRIAVDTDDHLPRRSEAVFTPLFGERRGDTNRISVEVRGNLAPPAATPEAWAIAMPEGWRLLDMDRPQQQRPAGLAAGTEAPAWTLADGDGNEHSLADLRGRVVILDFWATWCGPCKMAMPGLQRLHEEFAGEPVTVIGVSTFERGGDPSAYMTKQGLTYLGLVKGDQVARAYGVSSIPHLYVIGPDGTIAHQTVGYSPDLEKQLGSVVRSLLDG
ncbi:MAG: TlpA family protein disulfide reductase [Planctomycetota bacterium]|jgi:peroxiredoxin